MYRNKLIIATVFIAFIIFSKNLVSVINNFHSVSSFTIKEDEKISNKKEYDYLKIDKIYEKKISDKYKKLMFRYVYKNYSMTNIELTNPKIIIVHSTESKNIQSVLSTFTPDSISGRDDISSGGDINVGVHFLVDRDGTIYSFIPLDTIARHTIGFNYTAIGIENVGYSTNLTKEQLISNIKLVSYLKNRYDSIEHVIGHYEYNDTNSKHYYLVKQLNKDYKLSKRYDPSYDFINNLRKNIK